MIGSLDLFFLASLKRFQEIKTNGTSGRKVLSSYTQSLLIRYAEISGTATITFYSLFAMQYNPNMVITIPFVLFGLFRYWYLVESQGMGESPTNTLYTDPQLFVTILIWLSLCLWQIKTTIPV